MDPLKAGRPKAVSSMARPTRGNGQVVEAGKGKDPLLSCEERWGAGAVWAPGSLLGTQSPAQELWV